MGEWSFLGGLFDSLQAHSPMLGRFWLFIMLVFRILILGTVGTDLFEDEQEEFTCNTLQPGCKQVCYDQAFPISLYRFWVFHIVLISTPALLYLLYAMHQLSKKKTASASSSSSSLDGTNQEDREARRLRQLYLVNVAIRLLAEVGVLLGQWCLYGFRVEAQFPCSRFPCPYTVDCFTSRPAEKSIFLVFYFGVGVVSGVSSLVEILYAAAKWFCPRRPATPGLQGRRLPRRGPGGLPGYEEEMEKMAPAWGRALSESALSATRMKAGPVRSSGARKTSGVGQKSHKNPNSRPYVV